MPDEELVRRVADSLGVSDSAARRAVGDVIAFHNEPVEAYVRRRHEECRQEGLRNAQTYALVAEELTGRIVAAPSLTERQVRRIVYG
jgi:hypothetical protein